MEQDARAGQNTESGPGDENPNGTPGTVELTAPIINQRGLHARAAAKFVKLAGQFDAAIAVSRAGQEVSGISIMGLMMLAAAPGTEIHLRATGADAAAAIGALAELVADKFGEE